LVALDSQSFARGGLRPLAILKEKETVVVRVRGVVAVIAMEWEFEG